MTNFIDAPQQILGLLAKTSTLTRSEVVKISNALVRAVAQLKQQQKRVA